MEIKGNVLLYAVMSYVKYCVCLSDCYYFSFYKMKRDLSWPIILVSSQQTGEIKGMCRSLL